MESEHLTLFRPSAPLGQLDLGLPPQLARGRTARPPSIRETVYVVYIAWSRDDGCLYVGQSIHADERQDDHRRKKPWYADAATWERRKCSSVWEMNELERELINTLRPLHKDRRPHWGGPRLPADWTPPKAASKPRSW